MRAKQRMLDFDAAEELAPEDRCNTDDIPFDAPEARHRNRKFRQDAAGNFNTQRRMAERCLKQADGNVTAAKALFARRLARALVRRKRTL